MNVEIFALCDAATEQGGKLNILGAFDQIWSRKMPAVHPQCTVALRIRFSRIETGAHRVRLSIVDGDGKPLMPPLDANIQAPLSSGADSGVTHMVLNMQQVKFETFGRYSIDLAIDGKQEGSLPLYVRESAPEPAES